MNRYSFSTEDIIIELDMMTRGMSFHLPISTKMTNLYNGLLDNGFIGRETRPEHFCVVLGRYLHKSEIPYVQVRWLKDLQLFRFFIDSVCSDFNWVAYKEITGKRLFNNKGKAMSWVRINRSRLETRAGFMALKKLIDEYLKG